MAASSTSKSVRVDKVEKLILVCVQTLGASAFAQEDTSVDIPQVVSIDRFDIDAERNGSASTSQFP